MAEDDYFGLITFAGDISHWKRELVQASKQNVESAKNFAREIQDRGCEAFNKYVRRGCERLTVEQQ